MYPTPNVTIYTVERALACLSSSTPPVIGQMCQIARTNDDTESETENYKNTNQCCTSLKNIFLPSRSLGGSS